MKTRPSLNYGKLPTEMQNPKTRGLDTLPIEKVLSVMDAEDLSIPYAIRAVNPQIVRAVKIISSALTAGGRLFFAGAGTSGRLGIIEAAECPPTFNTQPSLVQAWMAGGRKAVFRSQEGAEDRVEEARKQVRKKIRRADVLVGISASGVTPFVRGALQEAKQKRAKTILIACNGNSPLRSCADLLIAPQVGPEVISGSTRLKAGTATKLILNRLTVASMVRLGKVYENWMVDLQPRSKKLRERAVRMVAALAGLPGARGKRLLAKANGHAKAAILMGKKNLSYRQALKALRKVGGRLRRALAA